MSKAKHPTNFAVTVNLTFEPSGKLGVKTVVGWDVLSPEALDALLHHAYGDVDRERFMDVVKHADLNRLATALGTRLALETLRDADAHLSNAIGFTDDALRADVKSVEEHVGDDVTH